MLEVVQKHRNGCALAAIASVTEITYDEAWFRLRRFTGVRTNDGLPVDEIRKCLLRLGRKSSSEYVSVSNRNALSIGFLLWNKNKPAILCLDNYDRTFHCIVWSFGRWWDPGEIGYHHIPDTDFHDVFRIIFVDG